MNTPQVALAFVGGALTIASPCVLPVLPFVFSRAARPFATHGLPLLLGLAIAFTAVASLAAVGGSWAVAANQYGRYAALSGKWTAERDRVVSPTPGGHIFYRFNARDVHLVLGPASDGRPARFRVRIDGRPPLADHGFDTDAQGFGSITRHRLYQLVRQRADGGDRTFDIEFLDPGAQAHAFTFG